MVRTRVTLLLGVWGASLQREEVWKVKDTIWFVLNSVKQLLHSEERWGVFKLKFYNEIDDWSNNEVPRKDHVEY